MTTKYGYWTVNEEVFYSKYHALVRAGEINAEVKFHYHNNVWMNFNRNQLGKLSLETLYKQRAYQLRDRYDYLILYYSGGADSHNILKTYIDNKIPIDEICVKWPKNLINGNFYIPNNLDTSARNYWSEWNYAIEPILTWVAKYNRNIKITIKDYTENIHHLNLEQIFENLNFVRGGGILQNSVLSDSDIIQSKNNKKVGNIYGIDKPLLFFNDNKIYFFFTDVCLDQLCKSSINPENSECFYWAPDFPLLTVEMAYQLALNFNINRNYLGNMWNSENIKNRTDITQFFTDISRKILYKNWDDRFQANKPNATRTDKFFWFYEHPELQSKREEYFYNLNNRVSMIDNKYLTNSDSSIKSYNICKSNYFFLMETS